jgi:hypothetical protein
VFSTSFCKNIFKYFPLFFHENSRGDSFGITQAWRRIACIAIKAVKPQSGQVQAAVFK